MAVAPVGDLHLEARVAHVRIRADAVPVAHVASGGQFTCDSLYVKTLLNVLWLVLAGFWLFLGYVFVAALWCVTVVGIPFGVASFRVGLYALWPFGRDLVKKPGAGVASGVGNFFWFILSGLWLAIGHAVTGVLLCVTIIGIPLGVANFKLVPVALMPLGREIVPSRDLAAAFAAARAR